MYGAPISQEVFAKLRRFSAKNFDDFGKFDNTELAILAPHVHNSYYKKFLGEKYAVLLYFFMLTTFLIKLKDLTRYFGRRKTVANI